MGTLAVKQNGYYKVFEGKRGIKVTIISDSISLITGQRIISVEIEYARIVHSEFMTHRMLSKNSSSSRAIPFAAMIENMEKNGIAAPVSFGRNQPGMVAGQEFTGADLAQCERWWWDAYQVAKQYASVLANKGVHKQVFNRLLEPFQYMKVIATATSWDNFFHLRNHPDADPTIAELASVLLDAVNDSVPMGIGIGEWHLPYILRERDSNGTLLYYIENEEEGNKQYLDLELAKKVSVSACAQTSYRKLDTSSEKADMIYKKLIESVPVHASPIEHQATPLLIPSLANNQDEIDIAEQLIEEYCTHFLNDEYFTPCSGNFKLWGQLRQTIPNNVCNEYEGMLHGY